MSRGLPYVIGDELALAVRTRKLLVIFGFYFVGAILGAWGVTSFLDSLKQTAVATVAEELEARGGPAMTAEQVNQYIDERLTQAVDDLSSFTGSDPEDLHPVLRRQFPVALFFTIALWLLPLMTLFASFDLFTSDLRARTFCYSTLRHRRSHIYWGRVIAHTLTMVAANLVAAFAFVVPASSGLSTIGAPAAIAGTLWVCLLLTPFTFAFVGLCALCSVLTRRPAASLAFGMALFIGIVVVRGIASAGPSLVPEAAALEYLRMLTPGGLSRLLWYKAPLMVLGGAGGLTLFGLTLSFMGWLHFKKEDL
jgi:ABC-type transport system involved in multi-copper enzyme maturation permease subunit